MTVDLLENTFTPSVINNVEDNNNIVAQIGAIHVNIVTAITPWGSTTSTPLNYSTSIYKAALSTKLFEYSAELMNDLNQNDVQLINNKQITFSKVNP